LYKFAEKNSEGLTIIEIAVVLHNLFEKPSFCSYSY